MISLTATKDFYKINVLVMWNLLSHELGDRITDGSDGTFCEGGRCEELLLSGWHQGLAGLRLLSRGCRGRLCRYNSHNGRCPPQSGAGSFHTQGLHAFQSLLPVFLNREGSHLINRVCVFDFSLTRTQSGAAWPLPQSASCRQGWVPPSFALNVSRMQNAGLRVQLGHLPPTISDHLTSLHLSLLLLLPHMVVMKINESISLSTGFRLLLARAMLCVVKKNK